MRFDPLVPVPLIVAGVVVIAVTLAARVVRAGVTLGVARGALGAMLAIAVVADPTVAGGTSDARRVSADVIFVVDSTSSMAAIDYDGESPRLEGVRADILELAEGFRGANFTLVRFDSQARLELPWTTDFAALETAVSVIRQERAVYSRGSSLDLPLEVLDQLIPRLGVSAGDSGRDSYTVVFYFSDGEQRTAPADDVPTVDTETAMVMEMDDGTDELATTFAELAPDIDGGAVLGYGTAEGAPMIEFHGSDELVSGDSPYVIDYTTSEPAISRLDEENLTGIAGELGVPYLHRIEPGGLGGLASELAGAAPIVERRVAGDPRPPVLDPGARPARRGAVAGGGHGDGGARAPDGCSAGRPGRRRRREHRWRRSPPAGGRAGSPPREPRRNASDAAQAPAHRAALCGPARRRGQARHDVHVRRVGGRRLRRSSLRGERIELRSTGDVERHRSVARSRRCRRRPLPAGRPAGRRGRLRRGARGGTGRLRDQVQPGGHDRSAG